MNNGIVGMWDEEKIKRKEKNIYLLFYGFSIKDGKMKVSGSI
jgi:hypothetical protein